MEKETQTKTQLKEIVPLVMVDSVPETVAYYKEHLGFDFAYAMPEEGEWLWAMVQYNSVHVMFEKKDALVEEYPHFKGVPAGGSFLMYVQVGEGIESLYEQLKADPKVSMVKDLHTTHYEMQEFAVKDCNDYTLTFGQHNQQCPEK